MIGLAFAVVVASVLGSLHCIGMCGPLALWASGVGQRDGQRDIRVWSRLAAYHGGRLLTYSTAGAIAGLAGAMLTAGGALVGAQALAARVVGVTMIAMGLVRGMDWIAPGWTGIQRNSGAARNGTSTWVGAPQVPWITRFVAARRPWIGSLPVTARGIAAGALTTLLPCGWLYLFVLVAAGTGAVLPAMGVMLAFWLGTLPALTALVAGTLGIAPRFRPWLPVAGALLLVLTGLYTATGRAAADMAPLSIRAAQVSLQGPQRTLEALQAEELPCCVDDR